MANLSLSIGILITNYNTWDLVDQCIQYNEKFCKTEIEKIVVVDDCSPTKNYHHFPDYVTVIRNETNLGYVKSINVGLKSLDTDIIVILDSDAYPLMNYVPIVRKKFEETPALGMIGFKNVDEYNRHTGSYEPEPSILTLLLGQKLMQLYNRNFSNNDKIFLYSCSIALRKECLDDIGGYDENFDYLDADADQCMRINRSKWRLIYEPEIVVHHKGGNSISANSKRVLMYYKSRWLVLKKFNKIKFIKMAKYLIISRLVAEYIFLEIFGRFIFKNHTIATDKISGRKSLIKYCYLNY